MLMYSHARYDDIIHYLPINKKTGLSRFFLEYLPEAYCIARRKLFI